MSQKNGIDFVKAVASGNDFIIIDNFRRQKTEDRRQIAKLAQELCQRNLSVGADGLLLIEPSKVADFKMRIFNPDGSEVDMCGNGSRCVALYANKSKIVSGSKMAIETKAGNLQAVVQQDKVKIKMSPHKNLRLKIVLDINGQKQNLHYINTGVPHVVCFVPAVDNFDVCGIGKTIRYHPEFQPQGTNVDFVEVLDKNRISIRTYERGVEQETLSCGSGAVAASIITAYEMQQKPRNGQYKIRVDTKSGRALAVYFNIAKGSLENVFLEGRAKIVYKGKAKV